jgi:hypothetical protein
VKLKRYFILFGRPTTEKKKEEEEEKKKEKEKESLNLQHFVSKTFLPLLLLLPFLQCRNQDKSKKSRK